MRRSVVEVGVVTKATVDANGVTLELDLIHRMDLRTNGPAKAVCQLMPDIHGVNADGSSFGDWWVPSVGTHMACFFPGGGKAGDDLGNGFALGVASSAEQPPVGGLSKTEWVFEAPAGTNRTHKIHGDETREIDGNDSNTVGGDETDAVTGSRTKTTGGDVSDTTTGNRTEIVIGTTTKTLTGAVTETHAANWTVTAPQILLGSSPTKYVLCDVRLLTWLASHTHGPGQPVPTQAADLATVPDYCTTSLQGS